jgi:hypothetical protein
MGHLCFCNLAFFETFHLSLPIIYEKLPFLITQGVLTSLYVSAISIVIASAIAILGAVAKLSTNGFAKYCRPSHNPEIDRPNTMQSLSVSNCGLLIRFDPTCS